MPPRTDRAVRTKKHKKKLAEIMDISQSTSTNLNYNQPESWECPLSARRHLIPDSATIPSRGRSLRSSKRLIETRLPSLSRYSQPQKSREHSSPTDVVQQLDGPVDTLISANQAQETFAVGIPEMMEQGEAEMSLSNDSNEMQMRNAFKLELERIPLEQDFAEDIEASNKNHTEFISMVRRRPCPSFSLKLTEMANMCDDEDEEDDSVTQSWHVDTVNGYKVKPESIPILRKIITKHGDIAKNCTELTMEDRSVLLEVICGIISELQVRNFSKIKEDFLRSKIALLNDIKNTKMDIEWLHMRLVEMLDARKIINQTGKLKEKRESNRKTIEVVESELKECEAEKKELSERFESVCNRETVCKERLAAAMDVSSWITENVQYAKSQVTRFLNRSPVDDLL